MRKASGGAKPRMRDIYRRRTLSLMCIFCILFLACFARFAQLQLFRDSTAAEAADRRTVVRALEASRGTINDANGVILAQSADRYTVYADQRGAAGFEPLECSQNYETECHQIDGKNVEGTGPAAVARLLAPVLGEDTKELGGKLVGDNAYVVLKKNVTPEIKRKIDDLNLAGIIGTEKTSVREYPNDTLLGSILGGIDNDGNGVAGVEKMADESLKGENGSVRYQQGMYGQEIPGTQTETNPEKNGGTVNLTIDQDVQWYVNKALKEGKEENGAAWGVAVVQEVSTGKILAISDTDAYAAGSADAKLKGSRAMTYTYDPGSTGKVITVAGVLQEGLHKITDRFSVPESITLDGQTFRDASSHGAWNITLAGVLTYSSNVGTLMASQNYSLQKRYEYMSRFGLGQLSGINFPGESPGLFYNWDQWDGRMKNTVLFGQGYTSNALQMTNVFATIANKGVRMGQKLIDKSSDANGNDTTPETNAPQRVLDEQTAADILNALETDSEFYKLKINGYRYGAKTGTAEVASDNGELSGIVGDFIAVVPSDNPRYVVSVFYRDPVKTTDGLQTAGPTATKIGEFLMQKYQVPKSPERQNGVEPTWR